MRDQSLWRGVGARHSAPVNAPGEVREQSDLYAVGAVGYFLLTGRHVFEGRTLVETLGHHLHSQPQAPSAVRGEPLARDVDEVILACLKKSPKERPSSARELLARIVACGDYGSWTEQEAHSWWEDHRDAVTRAKHRTSSTLGTRTVAVALRERARGAA